MTDARVRRGRTSEALIAEDIKDIFPDAAPPPAGAPGKDLRNTPGLAAEIKARNRFDPLAWIRQASRNANDGELPVVIARMTGQGEVNIDEWLTFTTYGHFKDLLRRAKYGRYAVGAGDTTPDLEADQLRDRTGVDESHKFGGPVSAAERLALGKTLLLALGLRPRDGTLEVLGGESDKSGGDWFDPS